MDGFSNEGCDGRVRLTANAMTDRRAPVNSTIRQDPANSRAMRMIKNKRPNTLLNTDPELLGENGVLSCELDLADQSDCA
jgi:hypothetical protein